MTGEQDQETIGGEDQESIGEQTAAEADSVEEVSRADHTPAADTENSTEPTRDECRSAAVSIGRCESCGSEFRSDAPSETDDGAAPEQPQEAGYEPLPSYESSESEVYYCWECNSEVEPLVLTDGELQCPQCQGCFVELQEGGQDDSEEEEHPTNVAPPVPPNPVTAMLNLASSVLQV